MSHYAQQKFVEICFNHLKNNDNFEKLNVIDVGSYDMNGSIRKLIPENNYTGVDIMKGPNVDLIMNGQDIGKIGKKFDVSISCECFEHAENWDKIFSSMHEVLNDDGILIFTCASRGRIEHGTKRSNPEFTLTDTYYKNLNANDFKNKFNMTDKFSKYLFFYNIYSFDLYFIGIKNLNKINLDLEKIKKETQQIKNIKKELSLKRILYSHILSDKTFQDFRFLRRKIVNKLKSIF
jgi:SAM-dependent methyltransferase